MSLNWKGRQVVAHVEQACILGLKMTGSNLLIESKSLVHYDTGDLSRSIQMRAPKKESGKIYMLWGSFDINYAFWQEVLPLPRGKAYLRPSADKWYPTLPRNIAKALGAK